MDALIKGELVEILDALSNFDGADFPRKSAAFRLREALATASMEEIKKLYCSGEWWGGAGSMADFIPDGVDNHRAYLKLLIRLENMFDAAGCTCPRAAQLAEIFQKWLDKGVI